ncbi:unnamed protein product [Hyaloperonospora brassicae]|uniref:AAA+ ATPase domain-containing protein n=1 Tax=Hyaloperonospora brassicae TaxID=162125 RepID=A0AAV0T9M1_HYABA|nr:unnamed protein product [Hyaloperonospora brassicae]
MRPLRVDVAASGTASSVARVSPATFQCHGASYGSYVSLQCSDAHRLRVFRLEMDPQIGDADRIVVDHWPFVDDADERSCDDGNDCIPNTSVVVQATCVAPCYVPVAQLVTLAPGGGHKQPQLALAFVQRLLERRILMDRSGKIALQWEGVDYGEWTYEAFFRGRCQEPDDTRVGTGFDGGIVTDQTLVLLVPSMTLSVAPASHESQRYYPLGVHARACRELVAMAIRQSSSCGADEANLALITPYSLLLHAPSGAGKTTLVKQIAEDLAATLLVLDCGLLASPQLRLEDVFSAALRVQPCVLLLEDLELMFPMTLDESKYRLVCRLVQCFDSIQKSGLVRIAVVGTVSLLSALHSKVRQLFVEEVYLDVPEKQWTVGLLESLLPSSRMLRHEFITSLAVRYGQRPSNVASIARQICARLSREDSHVGSVDRFEAEIAAFARDISSNGNGADTLSVSIPDVSWDDIGGLECVKQKLVEMAVWPLEKPHVFRRMGISPPLGMVLHGPPGTGKTMLAKATAKASGCNFLTLAASDLMRAEIGESEKSITRAFDTARALSPCMVFIDEFQSLFGNRSTAGQTTSRMISQLLMELDALKAVSDDMDTHGQVHASTSVAAGRVFVLVATNALSAIDPAFLQPGRFENVVYVGLPDASERKAIMETQRKKMPWSHDVDIATLVEDTDGANAASMIALCQAAAIQAMQRVAPDAPLDEQCIAMIDFTAALAKGNFDFQDR